MITSERMQQIIALLKETKEYSGYPGIVQDNINRIIELLDQPDDDTLLVGYC